MDIDTDIKIAKLCELNSYKLCYKSENDTHPHSHVHVILSTIT